MSNNSHIEWTHSTWNPLTGCEKVSPGCKNCYAERLSFRLKAMGQLNYRNGFLLTLHEHALRIPLKWKKPRLIFVNSMSDLFHRSVPVEFIESVFETIQEAHQHIFQVLTKRSDRIAELSTRLRWPKNLWMGVSVENEDYTFRIDHLRQTQANVKFLSLEPLIGPIINLDLRGIDWAIVGGESGPRARRMDPDWVLDIRDKCKAADVPFFFKQWGGTQKSKTGRLLEGKTWDEFPPRTIM